jgi:dienelactone hydrolase
MLVVASCGGSGGRTASSSASKPAMRATPATSTGTPSPTTTQTAASHTSTTPAAPRPHAPFAVGVRIVTLVDRSRTVQFPGRAPGPRTLVTVVRYPAIGRATLTDAVNARPARAAGPFPLIVFGHGFSVTPAPYARLLQAWARAGYVVAAPVFPLENANAPGGPDESDLVNQPRDMSFVITRMRTATRIRGGFFADLINSHSVAVAGQSDGGETALAAAYDRHFLDRRIRAALILSGAEIPGVGGFDFPAPSPPLLATQGTADTINPPSFTDAFFRIAPPPKYLLTLFGAAHLGPYTDEQPQLAIVERVTIAFLDLYLKRASAGERRLAQAGNVAGVTSLRVVR